MSNHRLPILILLGAVAVLAFMTGLGIAVLEWPPYGAFKKARYTARYLIYGPWIRDRRVMPRRYDGRGVVIYDSNQAFDGLTVVQGHFEDGAEIRVYAMDGRLLHLWPMIFEEVWPNPMHIVPVRNVPKGRFGFHTQGFVLEPDGSIVVNFAEKGTAKFAPCGDVLWTVDRMTHHSLTRTAAGTYWIPTKLAPQNIPEDQLLPGVTIAEIMDSDNFYADAALLVGPDGSILREVPVLGPVLDWYAGRNRMDRLYDMRLNLKDPLHLNDIEVVTPALAARIAEVEPGDLLLSLRNLHALAFLDVENAEIRRVLEGPWIRQHDPDITEDGQIEVYDNGIAQRMPGRDATGSRIVRFDPSLGKVHTLYPLDGSQHFFSWIQGTHQVLPNGNRLITESTAGRVFEVTPDGETVWALVETSTERSAAMIEEARRFPPGYVDVAAWQCAARNGGRS